MAKTRSIFEEVGTAQPVAAAAPARRPAPARRAIAIWLGIIFVLIWAMIAVGGMTRLTDSGLSITEWRPVTGAVPPMSAAAWDQEFGRYRATPQFEILNREMTLPEFKSIYWWEWSHRQLGRLIGAVWALGFLSFLVRRRIPPGWTPRLLGVGLLGGLQGAVGWWMVSSGLTGAMTSVASYRLATHLGLAFILLGLIAWHILTLRREPGDLLQARRQRSPAMMTWGTVLMAAAFVQIVLGALVAGIDAGRNYPEWPLMAGQIVPPDALSIHPLWRNFLENPGLVQFDHRMTGYLLFALGIAAWWRARSSALSRVRAAFHGVLGMMAVQIALGIFTALYAAPWPIAIVHQLGAVVLFVLILRARFAAYYPATQRIARA